MSNSFKHNHDVSSKEATPKTRIATTASNVVDGNPNRSNSALILLDFQNEFCKLGGKLYDDVKTMMESNNMLKNVPKVLGTSRYVIYLWNLIVSYVKGNTFNFWYISFLSL